MPLYTRKGDHGFTDFAGKRLPKDDIQIEVIGALDELNTVIGMLVTVLPSECSLITNPLIRIQKEIFAIGHILTGNNHSDPVDRHLHIEYLEQQIDTLAAHLPELQDFILPGGHVSACWAHLARTFCRETERVIVKMAIQLKSSLEKETINYILAYLNRLSDFLYISARFCNLIMGVPEQLK